MSKDAKEDEAKEVLPKILKQFGILRIPRHNEVLNCLMVTGVFGVRSSVKISLLVDSHTHGTCSQATNSPTRNSFTSGGWQILYQADILEDNS